MKTDAATRWMRLRMSCRSATKRSGRAHHWSGYLRAKPVQARVINESASNGVLHAFEGQHAEPGRSAAYRLGRARAEPRADQFADPIAAVVQQHQPDGHRNQQQVELAHESQRRRFAGAVRHVYLADGETLAGAGVALAAGLGQVLRVDGGIRVGRGQDIVDAVAARAVGHGLHAFLGGQPVVGSVEAHQAVRRHAELAAQPDVAVAAAARLADVRRVHRRSCVAGFDDLVLAVAIGAEGACVMPLARAWP
jgi:hypothetical protein